VFFKVILLRHSISGFPASTFIFKGIITVLQKNSYSNSEGNYYVPSIVLFVYFIISILLKHISVLFIIIIKLLRNQNSSGIEMTRFISKS